MNRADIRRLRQLEHDLAAREETVAAQELRILELMAQRDGLDARNRAAEAACAVHRVRERPPEPESARAVEAKLVRERAHAEALEEKLALVSQAVSRLGADLEAETGRRRALEAELGALEAALASAADEAPASRQEARLDGRAVLYVGGRPRQVANLRRFAESRGGRLLSHDGGIEDSMSLLPGLVGQSDLVLFPVECVSHEASSLVKRACETAGRPFRPVRSASLASFVQAVMSVSTDPVGA